MHDDSNSGDNLLAAIRERMKNRLSDPQGGPVAVVTSFSPSRLDQLEELSRTALQNFNAIGVLPPSPRTLRGRLGRCGIIVLQRLLGWYTPQIIAFNGLMAEAVRAQTAAISDLRQSVEGLRREASLDHAQLLLCLAAIDRPDAENEPSFAGGSESEASGRNSRCGGRS